MDPTTVVLTAVTVTSAVFVGLYVLTKTTTWFDRPEWIENKQRSGNEATRYFKVKGTVDGEYAILLLTEHEVRKGIQRAESHPEDLW